MGKSGEKRNGLTHCTYIYACASLTYIAVLPRFNVDKEHFLHLFDRFDEFDKYQGKTHIGQGGQGSVWKVVQPPEKSMAIKRIQIKEENDPTLILTNLSLEIYNLT